MTNRKLSYVVKDQKPLVLSDQATVKQACRSMLERRAGSVLVLDRREQLAGIVTGRDIVRMLGKPGDIAQLPLGKAMTRKPVTISPDHRAIDALTVMTEGGFRHVPVLDGDHIWGVVSRSDLKGMELEHFHQRRAGQTHDQDMNRPLANVVRKRKPLVLSGDATVADACRTMWRRKAGAVLVIDRRQRLVGIFTGRDAVRVVARSRDAAAATLAKAMTRTPSTLPPECSAIDALRCMGQGGFRHVPVISEGKIHGIVSRSDFTGTEIDRLDEEEHIYECLR